jgi:hypothetical protein
MELLAFIGYFLMAFIPMIYILLGMLLYMIVFPKSVIEKDISFIFEMLSYITFVVLWTPILLVAYLFSTGKIRLMREYVEE